MDFVVPITPVTKTFQVTKIKLSIPLFVLDEDEMDVCVDLYTDQEHLVERRIVHVPPETYKNWGTNDQYIVDYVLSQLELTRLT